MPPLGFSLSKFPSVIPKNLVRLHYLYKKRCYTRSLKINSLTRKKAEAQYRRNVDVVHKIDSRKFNKRCVRIVFFFNILSFCGLFAFSASLLGLNVSAPLSDDNMTLLVSDKKNHDM